MIPATVSQITIVRIRKLPDLLASTISHLSWLYMVTIRYIFEDLDLSAS